MLAIDLELISRGLVDPLLQDRGHTLFVHVDHLFETILSRYTHTSPEFAQIVIRQAVLRVGRCHGGKIGCVGKIRDR